MSGEKDGLLYWPKFFLDHSNTSFASWLGLLNQGSLRTQSPQSASWFSLQHPVSDWLEPPRHLVILFSNAHLLLLFFFLFTQVHLLTDSSVEGQYITIGLMNRVFTNGPWDWGSIPGRVIPKTQKMVLDATLFNTQHYKVKIKGKVEPSREWSSAFPYNSVQ